MAEQDFGLVGDIGATNSRLALVDEKGELSQIRVFASDEFATIAAMMEGYFASKARSHIPPHAVLAVAAPVTGDTVSFTNLPWTFSIEGLRKQIGFTTLRVINDFVANALCIPWLAPEDRVQVGAGTPAAGEPIGVIGPGSGLGVSGLIPTDPIIQIHGEGGHVTMAAADEREAAVLDLLRRRLDHVSAERVLSGPGLVNLYSALCELAGEPVAELNAAQITDAHTGDEHPRAREATAMFCAMLGTIAGNLALTLGARGGIYIAGGIVPRLGETFARSEFRARFEAKGRFSPYLAAIPTYVITRRFAALLGATKLLGKP